MVKMITNVKYCLKQEDVQGRQKGSTVKDESIAMIKTKSCQSSHDLPKMRMCGKGSIHSNNTHCYKENVFAS